MILTRAVCILCGLLLLVATPGCSSDSASAWNPLDAMGLSRARQEDTITIDVQGPIAVDVEAFNGDITVETDEDSTQAVIEIRRVASHGQLRGSAAQAALDEIQSSVQIVSGEERGFLGQVLQVVTTTTHAEPEYLATNIHITVPEVDGLHLRTAHGDIEATDVYGRAELRADRGTIRYTSELPLASDVTIINREGDVDVRVRGESKGVLDLQTVNGRVTHRVRYANLTIHNGTNQSTLHAILNNGENPVTIRTVDGDIRLAVVPDPKAVGADPID